MNPETLNLTELEIMFIDRLFKLLSQNGYDPNLIEIDRKSDNTLNFQVVHSQFGRIKLKGRKTKMQVLEVNNLTPTVTWYEDESFDFYISKLPDWLKYVESRNLYDISPEYIAIVREIEAMNEVRKQLIEQYLSHKDI